MASTYRSVVSTGLTLCLLATVSSLAPAGAQPASNGTSDVARPPRIPPRAVLAEGLEALTTGSVERHRSTVRWPLAPAGGKPASSNQSAGAPGSLATPLVFGADDRIRVQDTRHFPFNVVVYVESAFPDGSLFGFSGVLIAPYTVLTAANALFQNAAGGFAESVEVAAGQTQPSSGAGLVRPFGSRFATVIEVPQEWVDTEDPRFIYGAVFLDEPFDGISTFMPLLFDAEPTGIVNLAGYDQTARGEADSFALWTRSGHLAAIDAVFFDHLMDDDGGAIGAPVWEFFDDSNTRRAIGLDCCVNADASANAGILFTTANRDLILDWIDYRPGPSNPPPSPSPPDPPPDPDPLPQPEPLWITSGDQHFRVTARWRDFSDRRGNASPASLTNQTGYFWFFTRKNVEVVVKIVDGCGFNDRFWVFAAGLTNVEVELTVEHAGSGKRRRYLNPLGIQFSPLQDIRAFAGCGSP